MVRVRIGPSPTGDPHVGTAYIALFNYVFAKQNGGTFVLRIEDTDRTRSNVVWEQMIIDALKWLGLTWDEGPDIGGPHGPYRQSERGAIYKKHADLLLGQGDAYPCFCTPERLAQLRASQRLNKQQQGYDGHCLALSTQEIEHNRQAGVPCVIRLKVDKQASTRVHDRLRGDVLFDNIQVDDQVLLKGDGMPTYHLANVVDDHLMGMTHVVRAEEWITSTPKHVLLYEAFGWQPPQWIHMPLLRNADQSKISKRKNPVSLNYYREAGFLPEALLNYLGMMGWTMPNGLEKFTIDAMIESFDFDRISLGGPVFDVQKLTWLNGVYMRDRTPGDLVEHLRSTVISDDMLQRVAPLVYERIDKLEDFIDYAAFFFVGDVAYDEAATKLLMPKGRGVKETTKTLGAVADMLDALPTLDVTCLEQSLRQLCDDLKWKTKELFMPLRVAVTGRKATPPLFDTMVVLGKERCRRRLRNAIVHIRASNKNK